MLKVLRAIERPEYFFRPSQIWRKLRKNSLFAGQAVQLAWGLPVEVDIGSHVGIDILNLGVYDRVVAEAICRLSDTGEPAFDIGANIGQNASMMALIWKRPRYDTTLSGARSSHSVPTLRLVSTS